MEVEYYYYGCSLVDYICNIYGQRIAISVTRAMKYNDPASFTVDDAYTLLRKKLRGMIIARDSISERDCFSISFIHIWCQTLDIAEKIRQVHPRIIAEDESNTFHEVIILASV